MTTKTKTRKKAPNFKLLNKVASLIVFKGVWSGVDHDSKTNIYDTSFHFTGASPETISTHIYSAMGKGYEYDPLKLSAEYFEWLGKQTLKWVIEISVEVARANGSKEIIRQEIEPSAPMKITDLSAVVNQERLSMIKGIGINDKAESFFFKAGLQRPTLNYEFAMVD